MKTPIPANVPTLGRHNPRLAALREVVRHGRPGVALVDGRKLVLDLARAGVPPDLLLLTPATLGVLEECPPLASLVAAGKVFAVAEEVMQRLAPSRHPQGVLGLFPVPRRALPPHGVVVYLDRVQDPTNVGAIVRCAAALGATGVACSPGCADPFTPRAIRAAAGQTLLFPVATDADFAALASATRARTGQTAALAGAGGIPLGSWRARLPLLLVLGNEGAGLDPLVARGCDVLLTIPLGNSVESLNVAVAAGITLAALAGLAPSPILE
ncbi:MAG: RNA methyltransferase [Acidobacteriota bacterium]|jgi:TrmH family RNA methyltransferase